MNQQYWMLCSLYFFTAKYPFHNHRNPVLTSPSSVTHFSNTFKHLITYLSTSNVYILLPHIFHGFQACTVVVTLDLYIIVYSQFSLHYFSL